MKILDECFGGKVRLSDERLAHILEHPEMRGMADELERTLRRPQSVRRSRSDAAVRLFYEYCEDTPVGNGCASWLNTRRAMRLWSRPT